MTRWSPPPPRLGSCLAGSPAAAALVAARRVRERRVCRLRSAREVMSEEHRHAITWHSGGGVGRSYGTGVPLKVLTESMAKVRYEGLELG